MCHIGPFPQIEALLRSFEISGDDGLVSFEPRLDTGRLSTCPTRSLTGFLPDVDFRLSVQGRDFD